MNKIYATNVTNYVPIHDNDRDQPTEKNEIVEVENKDYEPARRSSSRRSQINAKIVTPLISRSVRARRRQAFLKTYQLSSVNDSDSVAAVATEEATTTEPKYGEKVREAVTKVKSAMKSLANSARVGLVKPRCCFRPVICESFRHSSSVRLSS